MGSEVYRFTLQRISLLLGPIFAFTMLQVLAYLIIEAVAATCFYPNGDANGDTPCYVSKTDSNCCGQGYACLSNKVCRQAHVDSTGVFMPYTYGRGSCTDRSWTSSACPLFCLIGSSRIQNCDKPTESKYCCAALNGTLTQDGLNGFCDCDARVGSAQPLQFGGDASAITTIGVTTSLITATAPQRSSAITTSIVLSTIQRPSSTSSSTSAVSSAASSTTQSSSSSAEAPNPNNRTEPTSSSMPKIEKTAYPNNDKAVIVGASVGTSIALICLAVLGFYIFYRKLQGHRDQSRKSKVNPHLYYSDPYPDPGVQELFGGQRVHELPAERFRHELPGDVAHYELPSAGAA